MKRLFCMLMILFLLLPTAVAEQREDPVVIRVGNETVPLSTVQAYYDALVTSETSKGATLSSVGYETLRNTAIQDMITQCILHDKFLQFDLEPSLTAAEPELRSETTRQWEEIVSEYSGQLAEAYHCTEEAARDTALSLLNLQGYSEEVVYENLRAQKMTLLLQERIAPDVEITEEELQLAYEENFVTPDRQSYENNIACFEENVLLGNESTCYVPAGYRYVKHILLPWSQTQHERFDDDYNTYLEVYRNYEALYLDAVAAVEAGEDTTTLQAELEALVPDLLSAEAAAWAAMDDAMAESQPTLDAIAAALEEGQDFDELIGRYSEDPYMPEEGYAVHAKSTYLPGRLITAVMTLEPGQIGDPVATELGISILRYEEDVPAGIATMTEDMRSVLTEYLLYEKRSAILEQNVTAWQPEYEIFTEPDLISLPGKE